MLRQYQLEALSKIRDEFLKGNKKVLLHLSTGAGKTVIFCEALKGVNEKGSSAIVIVRGRKLVDQASARLEREGVPHGVLMAGHKRYEPDSAIQVCSVDTLISRKLKPKASLIIIDEADQACSAGYRDFLSQYPDAYILAVTATPYSKESFRHFADVIVNPISISKLIEQKYLVPATYYAPTNVNLKGVKITAGDYNEKQLSAVMEQSSITGDITKHWLRLAKGRPTLAFCVSINHSKKLCYALNEAGIRAEHLDADSSDEERYYVTQKLENKEIDVITNCGILTRGVDIPCVSAIILARPTRSLNLFIQICGRGTRPYPGKEDFLILDHANALRRHGLITDEHEVNLDGVKPKPQQMVIHQCSGCFAIFRGSACPQCDYVTQEKPRVLKYVDGELEKFEPDPIKRDLDLLKKQCKDNGFKRGWVYYQFKEKYGDEIAEKYMPKREVPWWIKTK